MYKHRSELLPNSRQERVVGWGIAGNSLAHVYRPINTLGIRDVIEVARMTGKSVGLRGAGRSYGDASMNSEGIVLDLTRMSRILNWDPHSGIIDVEPGVTVQQLWKYIIEDGWWPPVVPGTMFPTVGGCVGMNIHGKNNFKVGPIGDHVLEFDLLKVDGTQETCSRHVNSDLFHAVIGSAGCLGIIVRVQLQMKRVCSGLLNVEPIPVRNFDELFDVFSQRLKKSDYLVGWIDCFASGEDAGRGLVHQANYLCEDEEVDSHQSLRVVNQELPDNILGIVPKSVVWRFMRPLTNDIGVKSVNAAKYLMSLRASLPHQQSHAGFAFLLDYVPDWKKAYGDTGLVQFQSFVPDATARDAFKSQLAQCKKANRTPYLGVFKKHRSDNFLLSHAVDGYSLALDFSVTPNSVDDLLNLATELTQITLRAGGRFYLAKDSMLHRTDFASSLPSESLVQFTELKKRMDPEEILQTNLYRRLLQSA